MHPLSSKMNLPEQQYNFKVKVNYHNGMVSVHGPGNHFQNAQQPAAMKNIRPIPQELVRNTNHQIGPTLPIILHQKNMMFASPSFSASTASQPNNYEFQFANSNKTNTDISPFVHPSQEQKSRFINGFGQNGKDLQRSQSLNYQIQRQPSIDCVICERTFSNEEFAYHIQLHKNNKKMQKIENRMSLPSFASPQLQQTTNYVHTNQSVKSQRKQNSICYSDKNQQLYSFENKNNANNSFRFDNQSNHSNSRQQTMQGQIAQPFIQYISPPQSVHSSHNSAHNSMSGNPAIVTQRPPQIGQLQSGIRYINTTPQPIVSQNPYHPLNSSRMSSHQSVQSQRSPTHANANNQIINYNPSNQAINSHESQAPITSLPSREPQSNNQRIPSINSRNQQSSQIDNGHNLNINRKQIIASQAVEQNQSKIYEYFPQPGYLSFSQHRVSLPNANNLAFRNKTKLSKTVRNHNSLNFGGQDINQIQSQCSDSSISSIRQMSEPLQRMGKPELVKMFHSNTKRLDLSNIIGMSETLAREGMGSNLTSKGWNGEMAKAVKGQTLNRKQKHLISKSMMYQNQTLEQANINIDISSNITSNRLQSTNRQNLQMIPVQNRQIFRGIQVNEEQLRGYDSMLNGTRSSKSSAKTKIPRNYLAVNDFITGNYEQ